jgi:hypothetical protein
MADPSDQTFEGSASRLQEVADTALTFVQRFV